MGVFAPYDVATGLAMAPRWLWPTSAGLERMDRAQLHGGTLGDGPRLVFAGDLMPLRGWAVPEVDPAIRAVVASADVFVANCEGPVSEKPARTGVPGFRRERATVAWLRDVLAALGADSGRTVLSVANNHALDRGRAAFERTVALLRDEGVTVTGTGDKAPIVSVGGQPAAFIGWTEWMNRDDGVGPTRGDAVRELAIDARSAAATVVGLPHWGLEMSHVPRDAELETARSLVEAGVDLVCGHHPHVVQPMQQVEDALCAYSLGSLTGPASFLPAAARLSGLLTVALAPGDGRLSGWRLHPVVQVGHGRRRRLAPLSQDRDPGARRRRAMIDRLFSPPGAGVRPAP
jgi:hypothetical protein